MGSACCGMAVCYSVDCGISGKDDWDAYRINKTAIQEKFPNGGIYGYGNFAV